MTWCRSSKPRDDNSRSNHVGEVEGGGGSSSCANARGSTISLIAICRPITFLSTARTLVTRVIVGTNDKIERHKSVIRNGRGVGSFFSPTQAVVLLSLSSPTILAHLLLSARCCLRLFSVSKCLNRRCKVGTDGNCERKPKRRVVR